jgi:hypothetical protein
MAKAKIPKKTNPVKDASTSNPLPVPEATVPEAAIKTAEASSAIPTNGNTKKTETKRAPRKPEIVRSEPRANLLPINLEDEIRQLAYLLAERRGFESGHETEDWLTAEHEVRQRYQQHSA